MFDRWLGQLAYAGGLGGEPPHATFLGLGCVAFLNSTAMFSLFELEALCSDEAKLREFLEKYGVLRDVKKCDCGGSLGGWCKMALLVIEGAPLAS